jgi:cobalt/nickel transport system permease protein
MYAAALPFWYRASQQVRRMLTTRMVPVIALMAAFSFVVMMFNIPLPGGTTGHAVGGAIAAIVLSPWGATIAVSIALAIQALFFGDGGILAYGANAFNMAIVMPLVAWYTYRFLSGSSAITSGRRVLAGALAGWLSLNIAAFFTAVEFGIQPYLFRAADGTPLYQPYGLKVTIPAMVIPHLLIAGVVEAIVTSLIIAYLQRANLSILAMSEPKAAIAPTGMRSLRPLWVILGLLVLLAPLGLLAAGTAWGEWAPEELQPLLGFIPPGLQQFSGLWSAPMPDYDLAGLPSLDVPGLGAIPAPAYILSAVVGVALTVAVVLVVGRLLARRGSAEV